MALLAHRTAVLDFISTKLWLAFGLGALGLFPALYVIRHTRSVLDPLDITQPPPDISWRSDWQLYRSLITLVVIAAATVFVFSPWADHFANSRGFVPGLLGAFGAYAVGAAIKGWQTGTISPFVRGFENSEYSREEQPRKFWASLIWNGVFGGGLLALAPTIYTNMEFSRCDDSEDKLQLPSALKVCDELLANSDLDSGQRAELLGARGRIYHKLHADRSALADYTAAIELNPNDSYALYNRAVIYGRLQEPWNAIADYDASLKIRPDNFDAHIGRGSIMTDRGRFGEAERDYSRALEILPDSSLAKANRGLVHAWMNDRQQAERDFAGITNADEGWLQVLAGRAVLAMKEEEFGEAVRFASMRLAESPDDIFSLRLRANAYWKMGQSDLARDDDDRWQALAERTLSGPLIIQFPIEKD